MKDIYNFTATPGQWVYFDEQGVEGNSMWWKAEDAAGESIFEHQFGSADPGLYQLQQGGQYTITVQGYFRNNVGKYKFQLWEQVPVDQFNITIGDTIFDGQPGAGAGHIELIGVKDVYHFTATPGQWVYFDEQGEEGNAMWWKLEDATGESIYEQQFDSTDPGLYQLAAGGTYTITVQGYFRNNIGKYQFQLWDQVPVDQFTINVGDTVFDGQPSAGAGHIELIGVKDVYNFAATPGQTLYFDEQGEFDGPMWWRLIDSTGSELFGQQFDNTDPGALTLEAGGTYTLTVQGYFRTSIGKYKFQIRDGTAASATTSSMEEEDAAPPPDIFSDWDYIYLPLIMQE